MSEVIGFDRAEFSEGGGMSEWREVFLEELADEITVGFVGSMSSEYIESGIPFLRSKNVEKNGVKWHDMQFVSREFHEKLKKSALSPGDVVIVRTGKPGTAMIIPESLPEANCSDIVIVRPGSQLNAKFLVYYLNSIAIEHVDRHLVGAVQQHFNIGSARKILMKLPQLSEQEAIASILSSLDDKIDLLHRQNKTLESIAETLFRQWFIEEAQDDWKEVELGNFVELNHTSADKNYSYQVIEYLDTGSLTAGKVESFQPLAFDEAPSRAKRLVKHNDVLISTVRPDQKHYGIIKNPSKNLVVSTGFCVITCTKIDPHFVYLLLTNDEMTAYLHTIAEGSTSTYPSLKPSDIAAISFQLPSDEKMKNFAVIACHSWEKIEKNYIQIRTLEKLRDTLLPKLMSGEVRVKI